MLRFNYLYLKKVACATLFIWILSYSVCAQRTICGHIYVGQSNSVPADSVKLFTTSGDTAFTNSSGYYAIDVKEERDTLYLLYKDKDLVHFVITSATPGKFDIYLNNPAHFDDENAHELKQVVVHVHNYHDDSLSTRRKYNGIFNYERPQFRYGREWIITPLGGGMDIDALIRVLQFQEKHKQLMYRRFARQSEDQQYIDSRFSRSFAGRITHLDDNNELFKFMEWAKPSAMELRLMNDLELSQYIQDKFIDYQRCKVQRS